MMPTMTCDECRQAIAVADLTDWGDVDAVAAHCRTCPSCAGVVTAVRDSAQRAADVLNAIPPGVDSALVARRTAAEAALVRERTRRRSRLAVRLAAAVAVVAVGVSVAVSRSAPTESLTVPLRCLSADQAAALLAPQLGRAGRVVARPPVGGLSVLTITGPVRVLVEAQQTLGRFDNADALPTGASCMVGQPDAGPSADAVGAALEMQRAAAQDAARATEEARRAIDEARRTADEARRAAAQAARP